MNGQRPGNPNRVNPLALAVNCQGFFILTLRCDMVLAGRIGLKPFSANLFKRFESLAIQH